ncbi:peptidase [Leptospira perolatii]|uniref:Peptidase n=1 Tax=Leptospira perolatii TaxID=2023191 RepID=A0A2M9ZJ57_9LEPT|nr:NfeD family protein [Leptospira perolatii]PJZ68200.1 peptidase [Leptospira perolatii]PJZ72095.1 peptidase [Leptospira perolatii]
MDFLSSGNATSALWIGTGIFLIVAEFFIPGTFVMFLGTAAVLVGSLSYFIEMSLMTQFGIWGLFSVVLILVGGQAVRKFFPSSTEKAKYDQEDAPGKIVPVVRDVLVERKGGRVLFQGTEWDAISKTKRIPSGRKAKILERENLTFIVEPLDLSNGEH